MAAMFTETPALSMLVYLFAVCGIDCARKHGTCFDAFCVCCFLDDGLQQIALVNKVLVEGSKCGY